MEKNDAALEVIAKHSFATYEEWWQWENERLRNGASIVVESECGDCGQLTIIEAEEQEHESPKRHRRQRTV